MLCHATTRKSRNGPEFGHNEAVVRNAIRYACITQGVGTQPDTRWPDPNRINGG
jgi:hypothetical protein